MSYSNDELLTLLSGLLQSEQLEHEERLKTRAIGAFAWRTIDQDLARLEFDSALEQPAGTRSQSNRRELTYRGPGIEIEAVIDGRSRSIVGQLVPAQSVLVTLAGESTSTDVVSDELGRFRFDGVPDGPFSLSITTGDEAVIHTDWSIF